MDLTNQQGDDNIGTMGNLHQRNCDQQPSGTNVKHHYSVVDEVLKISTKDLLEFKKESDSLRQEFTLMKQHVINLNEETGNILSPQTDSSLRDLSLAITAQKDENGKLQSQITELKKETSQIQSLIITCVQKVAQLENLVGNYS